MGDEEAVEWTEDPILSWAETPPPERIIVRGAQLLRIYNPKSDRRGRSGFREAVLLAWAQRPDRRWTALLAWAGWCRLPSGQGSEAARCGWVLVDEDRVRPVEPVRTHPAGIEYAWYGHEEPCELGRAIEAAAALLPEQLREAALTPSPHQGP